MLRTVLLALHVAAGTSGIVLGPLVLWRLIRRSSRQGRRLEAAYLMAVAVVCVSAIGLVLNNVTAFWWLGPIAALTGGAAYGAHRLRRLAGRAARTRRTRLLGGTYVALVTALLVVSVGGWLSWVLPSVVGVATVEYVANVQRRFPEGDTWSEEMEHAV